ncbi:hypothetical protein M8J77_007746 [Diaphorina citri]|nr:hypothetical protein M8J77_007746 [Diaphorina citri]
MSSNVENLVQTSLGVVGDESSDSQQILDDLAQRFEANCVNARDCISPVPDICSYNRRKKAVRKVMEEETRSCPLGIEVIKEHYEQILGAENPMVDHIQPGDVTVGDEENWEVTLDDVDWAISRVNSDSAGGPDGVIVRAVKVKGVSEILKKIFERMIKLGSVVKCLKKARTVLIDKGGSIDEVKNWRPITILPIIRRIFEKILERKLRECTMINSNQRGFMALPGCAINVAIVENASDIAKREKRDVFCLFVDVNQAYNNVGHMQIKKSVDRIQAPDVVKKLVIDCQMGNESKFEIGLDKSTNIQIKRGLMQGAPLSPLLYNVATNHLIEELTEQDLVSNW